MRIKNRSLTYADMAVKISKLLFVTLFLFIFDAARAQHSIVAEMNFTTAIEDRKAVSTDTLFSANVDTIYCHSLIEGIKDTTEITHVWYYKEEEKARVNLTVASDNWRTWSSKTIMSNWTGHWRVMVEDEKGNILATKSFVVK